MPNGDYTMTTPMLLDLLRRKLITKKASLQAAQQQFVSNANACGGAIELCNELLVELAALPVTDAAEEKPGDEPEVSHGGPEASSGGSA